MVNQHPVAEARRRSRLAHPSDEEGMCLRQVRECYDVGPAADDAIGAWNAADHKHPETDPRKIPRGVPVFWKGGSAGHGHIAIGSGFGGKCFSTDIRRAGYFDQVPIDEIHEKWGLELLGWTEDLNGVRVYGATAPPAKKTAAAKKAPAKKTAKKAASTRS